jgi:hypothetical protein
MLYPMKRTTPRLVIAALLACCLLSSCAATGRPNPSDFKQQLATALPLNSTPAQVLTYLDHQKISHSPYRKDPSTGNTIEAELSIPSRRALVNPSYDVLFTFDGHDRLTAYDVQFLGYVGL